MARIRDAIREGARLKYWISLFAACYFGLFVGLSRLTDWMRGETAAENTALATGTAGALIVGIGRYYGVIA